MIFHRNSAERSTTNATKSTPPPWSSQEIRGTLGGGGAPWQCVPDRVYPVSGYGPPKNINQAAYQNRSNNNPETCATSSSIDTNRNSAMVAMTTTTDDVKSTASTTSAAVGQSIKSSKSFESGVLGQHANTPNGVIPWPGDRGKPRPTHQWDHHNGTSSSSSPHHHLHQQQQQYHQQQQQHQQQQHQQQHNGSSSYGGGGGEILYLGNRSSGVRTSSRGGPTYFSPQHNHVSVN